MADGACTVGAPKHPSPATRCAHTSVVEACSASRESSSSSRRLSSASSSASMLRSLALASRSSLCTSFNEVKPRIAAKSSAIEYCDTVYAIGSPRQGPSEEEQQQLLPRVGALVLAPWVENANRMIPIVLITAKDGDRTR